MADVFDLIVIGGGPAGQKAGIQGAKAGARVLLIDQSRHAGGECVHRGTIPSKTLRETALQLLALEGSMADPAAAGGQRKVASLMKRTGEVQAAHEAFIDAQLERNQLTRWHGKARFLSPGEIEVAGIDGSRRVARANRALVATGSRPRNPPDIPVDHEHILDSDSILSLIYLPASMIVLGGGVIACEYASIFSSLGVSVLQVDRADRPLGFLDPDLSRAYVETLEARGNRYHPGGVPESVRVGADGMIRVRLTDGQIHPAEKVLCALGREAQVMGLGLEAIGVAVSSRGHITVDENLQTTVPGIYAAGDVIGPPALAGTSMEQGRRAARHALGQPLGGSDPAIPIGIYSIPELASVGLTESEAAAAGCPTVIGKARYAELARGHLSGDTTGFIKLVADARSGQLIGSQVAGENAAEIIHVVQMALIGGLGYEAFINHVVNFPTLAEGFRVAALDIDRRFQAPREPHAAAA